VSISGSLDGPEKTRGGLATILETGIETKTGATAVIGIVTVNETEIATENIAVEKTIEKMNVVVELHHGIAVHLHYLMDILIKLRTTRTKKKASKYQPI
jgi:hypothetical protein